MKSVVRSLLSLSALILFATATASANQLYVFVTVADILAASNYSGGLSRFSNCNDGMTDCGVYAVGFYDAKNGTAATTATGGTAAFSPVSSGTAAWVSTTLVGGGPSSTNSSAWEAGGSPNTREQFMTYNTKTGTTGNLYDANVGGNSLQGLAAMDTSTQIGFLLNFGSANISAGTTTDLRLRVLVTGLNASTGAQDSSKNQGDVITIAGAKLSAVPEPSSVALILSGIAGIGFAARRRRKLQ